MARSWGSDVIGVLRGMQTVVNSIAKHQAETMKQVIDNSSVRRATEDNIKGTIQQLSEIQLSEAPEKVLSSVQELLNRVLVVEKGISELAKHFTSEITNSPAHPQNAKPEPPNLEIYHPAKDPRETAPRENSQKLSDENVVNISREYSSVKEKIETIRGHEKIIPKIELTNKDKELLRKLEIEHEIKTKTKEAVMPEPKVGRVEMREKSAQNIEERTFINRKNPTMKPMIKPKQTLSSNARERKVPSTRIQRLISFGTLGIGLGIGTIAEYGRRTLGIKEQGIGESLDNAFLTKANAERIVSTLCKVRGAALKIGQILSIQDSNIISPELQKVFERVRQSADFMPTWQVQRVLADELGAEWRRKVSTFDEKPFAAASIGQVHLVTLTSDGSLAAMKIQYPGVAEGIQSDIDNLVGVLKLWNVFPEGMFIDNVVEVAKKELAWEVDYVREAECSRKFRELLAPYPEYYVPKVIDNLCSTKVFTTELIDGVSVDKCVDMEMDVREHICKLIMQLCLKELFEFRYMQTDPNWANFFYNPESKQLILLDFGACRSYDKSFLDDYIEIIHAAGRGDRDTVLDLSRKMKLLTGYESKVMESAHVDAVMILGEVFSENNEKYDFGGQNVTKSMQKLVPTIITHRLCPPPEEIYSIHRKLSGVFLLCAKLDVKINCRELFQEAYENYKSG
ncbi:atypical kinase COQ8B, mitochondrial [Diachasma alloeum]|uniref:atypical kinase COQ8B, mitochondrial n=1 Tax=Diachasma alloeum TaxID=454923 RepID=UPI0007383B8C|nr:atypical kinase COQ8B, mitochondrial [Diachasma alloeum]